MGALVTTLYLVAALINLAPVSGVFGAARLEVLYGLPFADPNLLVLMRHRAVLFGIVGVLLAVAAFVPGIRTIATVAGLISMVSYIVVVWLVGPSEINDALRRVMWVDVVGIVALVAAVLIDRGLAR